jgi:hypothetical protein
MPKITKDFSEALGFRLLSTYTGFTKEYPVEAAKIQKIYDDNFKDTCYKCYPIITGAGVDPAIFTPKEQTGSIKTELRKLFPVKVVAKDTETIDLDDTEDEDETTAIPIRQPKPASPKQCASCLKLLTQLKTEQATIEKLINQNKYLALLNRESDKLIHTKDETIIKLQKELAMVKKELFELKDDPEFQAILDYQRKKRKQ